MIRKSTAIVTVQLTLILFFTWLLMIMTDFALSDALYETVSAISTVGLSRGLTPQLNSAGQLLIITAMFLGRVGPISMLLFFKSSGKKNDFQYADGKYIVG